MNFKQTDIQKFDNSGNFILNEEYILSYNYSDGWTERLFNIIFFVDIYYECKIDLRFIKKKDNNLEFEKIERQFELEIPNEIKKLIVSLISQKELKLKYLYADTFMEDLNSERFVINHKNISYNVGIGMLIKKIKLKNECEELFFQLHKAFEKWKEEIYKKILAEI